MCEQCLACTLSYGEVIPGWLLVRATVDGRAMKAGGWGLVRCNDPDIILRDTPRPDPQFGWDDARVDASTATEGEAWDAWLEHARSFTESFRVAPEVGWALVEGARSAGWCADGHGNVLLWLLHRIGETITRGPIPVDPHEPSSAP